MELNKEQKEAVEHLDGPCLVTANPGSGKTRVLVERVIRLLKEDKVVPKNIVVVTFTNAAGREIKERICKGLGNDNPGFFIGTFHSLCAKILRKIGPSRGYSSNFTILSDRDQTDMIMKIARRLGNDIKVGECRRIGHVLNFYRDQMEDFSWVEENLRNPHMVEIANEYLDRCIKDNMIDFSGLISECIRIIEENIGGIKEKIQNTFKYICVDEVQDTCVSQFFLINLLGEKWKNIMIVGDPNQSIYKFRGARYQNIQDFIDRYDDCRVIQLPKNYRSSPEIIDVVSKMIRYNDNNKNFRMITDNKKGNPVKCYSFGDQIKEAEWITKIVKKLVEEGGWRYSEIACIYRMNKMSQPLEQNFTNAGISYKVSNSYNFYDRIECRDSLSMLKLLANNKDAVAFHRVIGLFKGMGDITIGKIENKATENNISLIEACYEFEKESSSTSAKKACKKIYNIYNRDYDFSNPAKCLSFIIEEMDYKNYLSNKFGSGATEREENIDQIIDSCMEFEGKENGLHKYLQNVSLVTDVEKDENNDCVNLLSAHAAKGCEFEIVFVIGCEQGIFPHQLAMKEDVVSGVQEERRTFFVAGSRAKRVLYFTYCRNRKGFGSHRKMTYKKAQPSQFLYECGLIKEN